MPNHPNRGGGLSQNPAPELIRETRRILNISAREAGAIVHTSSRVWQQWEAGERRMHPAFWELFKLKTGRSV